LKDHPRGVGIEIGTSTVANAGAFAFIAANKSSYF
jgi:hypothetical protein